MSCLCIYCSPPSVGTLTTKRKYLQLTSNSRCDHDKTSHSTSYIIMNNRLFPVPLHEFEDHAHCPVCEGSNRPDEEEEPTRFIRWVNAVSHLSNHVTPIALCVFELNYIVDEKLQTQAHCCNFPTSTYILCMYIGACLVLQCIYIFMYVYIFYIHIHLYVLYLSRCIRM